MTSRAQSRHTTIDFRSPEYLESIFFATKCWLGSNPAEVERSSIRDIIFLTNKISCPLIPQATLASFHETNGPPCSQMTTFRLSWPWEVVTGSKRSPSVVLDRKDAKRRNMRRHCATKSNNEFKNSWQRKPLEDYDDNLSGSYWHHDELPYRTSCLFC